MGFTPGPTDPFIELMRPPPDETPAQATARQKRELDAQRRSDAIDESIKQARDQAKRERHIIKVLLLGQSESDFRMRYAREDWDKERHGWRAVVQLNIVRSITTILAVMEAQLNGENENENAPDDSDDEIQVQARNEVVDPADDDEDARFSDRHHELMIRLSPLKGVEAALKRRLGAGSEPLQPSLAMIATPFEELGDEVQVPAQVRRTLPEFSVRSWKDVLEPEGRPVRTEETGVDLDTVTDTIAELKDDMKALWDDRTVKLALRRRRLQLPDSAGFFLNDLERIAARDYVVSDNDIVRARLRTVGIQEHRLKFAHGPFDSGNSKVSPVSVFDQRLEEDPRVNRLEDSIILWTSICKSKLLAKTQLILFLNKCDLLRRKLKRGVQVKAFLPSYGERPNEVIPVVKYLREKFKDIQKHVSPQLRSTYIYPTTVTVRGSFWALGTGLSRAPDRHS
ncbi:hypothetical protein H0H81_009473 [Sphagnurus paluster]|uniref:G-alpha-domain-containing protein n=1 Tax=Sphagnurus paluster TaxID=117069 RepID=A0A9P7KG88_9AGAR|nr:hypothetical protein H0H81_009473 [Sphagnurus paluster]